MFVCGNCGLLAAPKSKPTLVIVQQTEREYVNYKVDEFRHEEVIHSKGSEIVEEVKTCHVCITGKDFPEPKDPTLHINFLGGKGVMDHARRCNKHLEECRVCQRSIEFMHSIPALHLSRILNEPPPEAATFQFATLIVESTLDRGGHKNKRADFDKAAGMQLLRAYEESGGKLRN